MLINIFNVYFKVKCYVTLKIIIILKKKKVLHIAVAFVKFRTA